MDVNLGCIMMNKDVSLLLFFFFKVPLLLFFFSKFFDPTTSNMLSDIKNI